MAEPEEHWTAEQPAEEFDDISTEDQAEFVVRTEVTKPVVRTEGTKPVEQPESTGTEENYTDQVKRDPKIVGMDVANKETSENIQEDESYLMTQESTTEEAKVVEEVAYTDHEEEAPKADPTQPEADSEMKEESEVVENVPDEKKESIHNVSLSILEELPFKGTHKKG